MRRIIVSFAVLLSFLVSSHAQAQPITPKSLAGKWTVTVPAANGPAMTTTLAVSSDMKFSGVATVDNKPYWEYSGRWELKDRQLTWFYEKSSKTLPESAKIDIDDVVSVSAKELVLASKTDGKKSVLARVKE